YDINTKQWVREVKPPFQPKPSLLEVHEDLLKLFAISQDKTTGMVKISVEHYSPYLAKTWVEQLVKAINDEMRQRELSEAQRSIAYLNSQIDQTSIADVRTMLYSLIEEQTKTVMLANVRDEYVFKTVDPAVVAEKKAKPKRALIVILAVMLGSLLSMMFVLVRYFSDKK
uniref:GNVR domain-containing protein n=1 Tax=Rheinheimera sp. TaxID=1869214 RepID=UPI004047FC75